MEKKFKVITIVLFLIILFGVGIFTVLGGGKKYSEFEKRELAKFPKTNTKTIAKGKFQKGLDNFLNDHVVFRDECIYASTLVDKMMGRAEKAGVYFGKDGYLIEKNEQVYPKDVRENVKYLSDFTNALSERVGSKNIKIVFIPNKINVLTDKLPKYATVSNNNWMKALLWEKLKDKSSLVDLTEQLLKHKDEYVYYKTDHHWTSLGAKYGYEAIMKSLGKKPYLKMKPEVVADDFLGTTYNKIHYAPQKDLITKYNVKNATYKVTIDESGELSHMKDIYVEDALKSADKYEYFMGGNYGGVKIHNPNAPKGTLVLFKDSFANCIIPFLTNNYSDIIMIDLRYVSSLDNTLNNLGFDKMDEVLFLFNEEKFMNNSHFWKLQ